MDIYFYDVGCIIFNYYGISALVVVSIILTCLAFPEGFPKPNELQTCLESPKKLAEIRLEIWHVQI